LRARKGVGGGVMTTARDIWFYWALPSISPRVRQKFCKIFSTGVVLRGLEKVHPQWMGALAGNGRLRGPRFRRSDWVADCAVARCRWWAGRTMPDPTLAGGGGVGRPRGGGTNFAVNFKRLPRVLRRPKSGSLWALVKRTGNAEFSGGTTRRRNRSMGRAVIEGIRSLQPIGKGNRPRSDLEKDHRGIAEARFEGNGSFPASDGRLPRVRTGAASETSFASSLRALDHARQHSWIMDEDQTSYCRPPFWRKTIWRQGLIIKRRAGYSGTKRLILGTPSKPSSFRSDRLLGQFPGALDNPRGRFAPRLAIPATSGVQAEPLPQNGVPSRPPISLFWIEVSLL